MENKVISQIAEELKVKIISSDYDCYKTEDGTLVEPIPLGLLMVKGLQDRHPFDIKLDPHSLEHAVKTAESLTPNAAEILSSDNNHGVVIYAVQLYKI